MKYACTELPKLLQDKDKKNGHTSYGKQNYQCKCCGRQFVAFSKHRKSLSTKEWVQLALKERLSLSAICRIFGISLTWLQRYAQMLWQQTPRNLGLDNAMVQQIKKLQVFGLQADEWWSFVQKKKQKRWIWVAYDSVHRLVMAYYIGKRGKKAAKKCWKKIPLALRSCPFETDDWEAYQSIIPSNQHKVGKDSTYYIEGFNATIRARVSRLVRKSLSFSKKDKGHQLAIGWFFWQFNLDILKHYI